MQKDHGCITTSMNQSKVKKSRDRLQSVLTTSANRNVFCVVVWRLNGMMFCGWTPVNGSTRPDLRNAVMLISSSEVLSELLFGRKHRTRRTIRTTGRTTRPIASSEFLLDDRQKKSRPKKSERMNMHIPFDFLGRGLGGRGSASWTYIDVHALTLSWSIVQRLRCRRPTSCKRCISREITNSLRIIFPYYSSTIAMPKIGTARNLCTFGGDEHAPWEE